MFVISFLFSILLSLSLLWLMNKSLKPFFIYFLLNFFSLFRLFAQSSLISS
jgi:hypothetical protein